MVSKKVIFSLLIVGIIILGAVYFLINNPFIMLIKSGGPGGCKGPDCEQFCQQNPDECQKWCFDNPNICEKFFGSSSRQRRVTEPPNTIITYGKSLNMISDLVTPEDIIAAKELGANMVTLWPTRAIRDDEIIFFPAKGDLSNLINTAHKNGLQVELRNSYGFGEEPTDLDKWKQSAINHVAEYAKFAEQHKVYRIIPFGELDNNLFEHPDQITEIAQDLLKEMRKHYSGQIGVGMVGTWRYSGYTFKGYDYMSISAYPQEQTGMDAWFTSTPEINLANVIAGARGVADNSGISILHIGETGVINPEDERSSGFNTIVVSKEKEAEFYDILFEKTSGDIEGVSVFYNSKTDFMSIKDDPAEDTIKEWYNKI